MYIDLRLIFDALLAFVGLMNLLVAGYYVKLTWKLGWLWYGSNGERFNGLTLAMCLERAILALVFSWNLYQSVQGIFQLYEAEVNWPRLLALLVRAVIGLALLVIIGYQDIKMQED